MRLPDFIGLGGMRCGSTTLWDAIRHHPGAFTPGTKELHFFDDRGGSFQAGVESYAAHFEDAAEGLLCGESTPAYLTVEPCAERIRRVLSQVRLFVVLRDPISRTWSHYRFMRNSGREALSFPRALDAETARRARMSPETCLFDYANRSLYLGHLRRFEAEFGRESLLVLLLDDWVQNPAAQIRRLCEHLGLDPDADVLHDARRTANRSNWDARSARLQHLARSLIDWGDGDVHGGIGRLARRTGGRLRRVNRALGRRLELPQPTRARLAQTFEPSVRDLERWLGRTLPWLDAWGLRDP